MPARRLSITTAWPFCTTGRQSYRTYLLGSITRWGRRDGQDAPRHRPPRGGKGWPMERELTQDETVTLLKDRNAKAREAINALAAEVAELREENKKLLDQLVAAGAPQRQTRVALQAYQAVAPWKSRSSTASVPKR